MTSVIEARGLAKTFRIGFFRKKVVALRDASFEVGREEIFGLIGPNGAGTTTTLKILTGLVRPDVGSGTLLGKPIGEPGARRALGYLPESPYFHEYLDVRELLNLHGALCGMTRAERARSAEVLIDKVGLRQAVGRPLRKFSKGMLQRAGLACSLIHDPALVILDEPQTGLDPIGRAEIAQLIKDLRAQGKSVFFASHILPDVERLCDRVAVMVQGRVVDVGPLDKLLNAQVLSVEILAEGLGESHRAEIEAAGMSWVAAGERISLTGNDPASAQAALAVVLRSGAAVRGYHERQESLEDLFLREVEGAARAQRGVEDGAAGEGRS